MEWNACHGDRFAGRRAARGQRDIQQPGGSAGVVVEHLVEIPHPKQQDNIRVLGLDAQILLHQRRVGFLF